MQGQRQNLLMSGLICLCMGAIITIGIDPALAAIGATIGLAGVCLFLWGFSTKPDEHGMSPEEIAAWTPASNELPEAGRVMYRIDTTLDEPKKTSILCGSCAEVTYLDGERPKVFDCPACGIHLWDKSEEE